MNEKLDPIAFDYARDYGWNEAMDRIRSFYWAIKAEGDPTKIRTLENLLDYLSKETK